MANHKSALKRVRSDSVKRQRNRYQLKTCRTYVKKIRNCQDKKKSLLLLKLAFSMLDKLAKRNIVHKNKASNLKSKMSRFVAAM